jgi:hypothetical protein
MSDLQTMTYEVGDRIARITLDRPERGNGLTPTLIAELTACVERADLDPAVHVLQFQRVTDLRWPCRVPPTPLIRPRRRGPRERQSPYGTPRDHGLTASRPHGLWGGAGPGGAGPSASCC